MDQGKNLWNAVDLISRAGQEIHALGNVLSEKMHAALSSEADFRLEKGKDDALNTEGDWVTITLLFQWWLKPKGLGKRNAAGNLSAQIVIWSDEGDQDPCGGIPRIEVAYMSSQMAGKDDYLAGSWFEVDGWDNWQVSGDRKCLLMGMNGQDLHKGSKWNEETDWIYAVPLFSVNCSADIEQFIIKPALKLLRGESPDQVLSQIPTLPFSLSKDGVLSNNV